MIIENRDFQRTHRQRDQDAGEKLFSRRNQLKASTVQISKIAIAVLVLLRLSVGWHFYKEGATKLEGGFSSTGFLSNAKGPFSENFRSMLWDSNGKIRLCYQPSADSGWSEPSYDTQRVRKHWERYHLAVIAHHDLDSTKAAMAKKILDRRSSQLNTFLKTNHEKVIELFNRMERREEQLQTDEMSGVASLRSQGASLEREIQTSRAELLASVDLIWTGLDRELNQLGSASRLPLGELSGPVIAVGQVDRFIPWFDITVGLCLLLGFLTPVAAVAAAGFLLSVVLSQFPGSEGAQPTYYQVIEMFALLVIAFAGAGKYISLDSIIYQCRRCCRKKQVAENQEGK